MLIPLPLQLLIGLILSSLIGLLAYRRGSLSKSGVLGAVLVGTAIFGFGGLAWGLILIVFFVTSSLLSHYKEASKEGLAEKFDKGHQRDLGQALANGGAGALIAVVSVVVPTSFWWAAFLGAMATVTADTWATELGVLNTTSPRLITTGKTVEVGTSGGVSLRGMVAALSGAVVIGAAASLFLLAQRLLLGSTSDVSLRMTITVAALGGVAGSLFDSLLGATVQAIYFCPTCQKETERKLHTCGTPTTIKRGWRWLNNDWVNFISSLFGAAISAGLWMLITL